MEKDKLKSFKEHFLTQKENISLKLKRNSENEYDVDGDEIDLASGASLAKMQEDLSIRLIKQLKSIEAAIIRIDNGTFGECEECGEDILEKRLIARPDAITCIVCAEQLEHKAKQFKKE